MYSKQDLVSIQNQIWKRVFLLLIPTAFLVAGIVLTLNVRKEWLTDVLFILMIFTWIFCWELFIMPLIRYKRFVRHTVQGPSHLIQGQLKTMMTDEISTRDGVDFKSCILNVGDMANEEDDRLFYYDANLLLPEWKICDQLVLTTQDKAIIHWEYAKTGC